MGYGKASPQTIGDGRAPHPSQNKPESQKKSAIFVELLQEGTKALAQARPLRDFFGHQYPDFTTALNPSAPQSSHEKRSMVAFFATSFLLRLLAAALLLLLPTDVFVPL